MKSRRILFLAASLIAASPAMSEVTVTYDALGRVASVTYDDGKVVTYAYDPAGNRTQHVVSTSTNVAPIANDDTATLDVAAAFSAIIDVRVNDTDGNNDPLIVSAVTNGTKGTVAIVAAGGMVEYTYTGTTLGPGMSTTDSFTYTISDGNGGTDLAQVSVTIENTACPGNCN